MGKGRRRSGTILAADDLTPDQFITIHHWRDGRSWGQGLAFQIKAVNLPYLIVKPVHDSDARPAVLDFRKVRLMRVSEEYVRAQESGLDGPAPRADDMPF